MSTIFEIVRLAQERYASNDHAAANRSYTDAEGNLLPTLAGAYTCTHRAVLTAPTWPLHGSCGCLRDSGRRTQACFPTTRGGSFRLCSFARLMEIEIERKGVAGLSSHISRWQGRGRPVEII